MSRTTADLAGFRRQLLDPEWYLPNLLKIRTKDQRLVPLRLNRPQQTVYGHFKAARAMQKPGRFIILKARQEGVSTLTEGVGFHMVATTPYANGLVVAHEDVATDNIFRMSRLMYQEMPEAIDIGGAVVQIKPKTRYSNRTELDFADLESRLTVATAKNVDAGRSGTLHFLHASEVAFWTYPEETMLSLMQAVADIPNSLVVLESTANGVGGHFYDEWQRAVEGESDFEPIFLPWFDMETYRIEPDEPLELDDEEASLRERFGVDDAQINWRRWTIRNKCRGSVTVFRQEYPSTPDEAFIVSGACFFDSALPIIRAALMAATEGTRGDVTGDAFIESGDGYLERWEPPVSGEAYVIGGDVAEGLEHGDYSVLQVLKRSDLSQVARWRGHTDPDIFGDAAVRLARYYNDAWLGIESNNHGISANKSAAATGYRWLYHRQTGHDTEGEETGARLGWETNRQTRPLMLDAMHEAIREGSHTLRDRTTLAECTTFVRKPNGKPEAATGAHDDCVMADAIAIKLHELCPMPRTEPIKRYVRKSVTRR